MGHTAGRRSGQGSRPFPISGVDFGVADGSGLLSLERVSELREQKVGIGIEIYGFDAGKGLPKPKDYRDVPYMWEEGDFSMDERQLRVRLKRAQLQLGLVEQTVPEFVRISFAPVACISFDLDLYSGTKQAFRLLEAGCRQAVPARVLLFRLYHGIWLQ